MKNKMHKQLLFINYITSSQLFKMIFLMTILIALIGGCILLQDTYIESILFTFQNSIFNVAVFTMLFLNTLNSCSIFDKNFSFYIMRLENKKSYVKELIKTTIVMTLFYLGLLFLLYFMILNFTKFGFFEIKKYYNYGVSNLIYVIFYILKYISFAVLLNIISTLVFVNFKNRLTLALDGIFVLGFMITGADGTIRNKFSLNLWEYFGGINFYSFMNEICYSILYIFLLEIIIYIIYNYTIKNRRLMIG